MGGSSLGVLGDVKLLKEGKGVQRSNASKEVSAAVKVAAKGI